MDKKKSNNMAVCIVCGVLTVFSLTASISSLCSGRNDLMVFNIVDSVLAVLIGYYGICGYRKPHGNLLKYVILIYAFFFLFRVYVLAVQGDVRQAVISAAVIGFCCYIAGRLHKVKQNTILMGIVAVLLVIATIGRFAVTKTTLGVYSILILWIDICVAYILRFKEHKEAGLIDKVEK